MYAVTSWWLLRRTRATFRSAEFGFFGVVVYTRVQTPRFCGLPCSAGALSSFSTGRRPFRTSWLIVGIVSLALLLLDFRRRTATNSNEPYWRKNAGTRPGSGSPRGRKRLALATATSCAAVSRTFHLADRHGKVGARGRTVKCARALFGRGGPGPGGRSMGRRPLRRPEPPAHATR